MASSEIQIANLLYLYAERMDAGDLDGAADLFRNAEVLVIGHDRPLGYNELKMLWRDHVKIHSCGTPRTRHIITNPLIEVDEAGRTATCRSCYTVLQATDGLPLQPIAAGRYHDRFEYAGGAWRFAFRDFRLLDLVGDTRSHLLLPLSG